MVKSTGKAEKRLSVAMTPSELKKVKVKAARIGKPYAEITHELWVLQAGQIQI
ncbi:MAG: hypothetical protein LC541_18745 [Candidatus Thiodiazotropha sp.]|nr:hypothetical protein [Candidatus Thiodiazotropha sp.]MCM8885307.1 hypothetical protein [Candidatus Thiodiazotropha sp.]MCM8921570.1 hypothetical protein [Candidatus Thiodiazotropha sp.]